MIRHTPIRCSPWLAEEKAQRRVFRLDSLEDRLGATDGIAGLIAAARFRLRAALAGGLLIFGKPSLRLLTYDFLVAGTDLAN